MKALIFISIFLITPIMIFAQTDTMGRFTVSIGGGLALPVGSYASNDANEAAVFPKWRKSVTCASV